MFMINLSIQLSEFPVSIRINSCELLFTFEWMIELKKALGVDDEVAAKKVVGRVSSFPDEAMALEEIVLAVLDFCALQTFA